MKDKTITISSIILLMAMGIAFTHFIAVPLLGQEVCNCPIDTGE